MRSSYIENHYAELLSALTKTYAPKTILEIGILDGASLIAFSESAPDAEILAFDLFEEHVGKHPDETKLRTMFSAYPNVRIDHGDFYKLQDRLEGLEFDLIHIDISNHGGVYEHAFKHYLPLLSENGLLLLEGGTAERDQVEWMSKYKMPLIQPVLAASGLRFFTLAPFPGLTILHPES